MGEKRPEESEDFDHVPRGTVLYPGFCKGLYKKYDHLVIISGRYEGYRQSSKGSFEGGKKRVLVD